MNFKIKALAQIIHADEQSIADAAKLFGFRRVGPFLCLSRGITPEFVEEVWRLQAMRDAANARRMKHCGSAT